MSQEATPLRELALLFLRLGTTAFGGPAAHIAMMEEEVVRRRQWLSPQRFLDLLGATQLIPGPNSTELAIHIGWERRRWAGLLVAGVSFILPAMLLTSLCGYVYVRFGTLPSAAWLLYGVKPVMVAIVVQALIGLAPKAASNLRLRLVALAVVTLVALGVHELWVLFGAGAFELLWSLRREQRSDAAVPSLIPLLPLATTAAAAPTLLPSLSGLFWVFAKIGSVLFGSGYTLLAFLRADLVTRYGWLTEVQLVDAVAVGQITPGPVFTTATFIGYVLRGPLGALVATAGIFLPAFVFVALSGPLIPRIRDSARAAAFLDGVNVASLALMAVVTAQLGRASIVDPVTAGLALLALALLYYRVNSTWLIAGGALFGWLAQRFGVARLL